MFLLVRDSLTNCSELVTRGNRCTRKTLEPKLAILSATYLLVASTIETTTIRVATARIIPSRVRNDRSLWARRVSSAILAGSLKETGRVGSFVSISQEVSRLEFIASGICIYAN